MYWLMATMSSMEQGLFNTRYTLCSRSEVLWLHGDFSGHTIMYMTDLARVYQSRQSS